MFPRHAAALALPAAAPPRETSMLRAMLLVAAACAALPAAPQGFIDRMVRDQQAEWQKERLEALEKDPDPRKRVEAADSFAGRNDPESLAALARALGDRDAKVRAAAASGLWRGGDKAAPHRAALQKALDDPDPDVVATAAGALASQGVKRAELAPANRRVLESPAASVSSRFYAARALTDEEAPPRLLGPMLAYLERNAGRGRPNDASSTNMALAQEAMERLVKATGDKGLVAPLLEALDSAPQPARPAILKAIGAFDPLPAGVAGAITRQLDSPDAKVRYAALSQLRRVKDERDVAGFVPRAADLLRDPDSSVRSEALWALGGAGGLAAAEVERVAAALQDKDESVRRSAARALGEIGDARQAVQATAKARVAAVARPALEAALERDGDRDVRGEAKAALAKLDATAGTTAAAAVAVPASPQAEAEGLATLRARGVKFEETGFFVALQKVDVPLARAFLDAGMSAKRPLVNMGSPIRAMLFASPACSARERPTRPATVAMVKLLLERGADPNQADEHGNTALQEAASKGCDREVMRLLIKAGADVNAKNKMDINAFEMGLWNAHDGLEELVASGFRLAPARVKVLSDAYKDKPASLALVRKAAGK